MIKRTISLLALSGLLLLPACQREGNGETVFRTLDVAPGTVRTRSLLTAPDIETKKTGITLAVYADGKRIACTHFTS